MDDHPRSSTSPSTPKPAAPSPSISTSQSTAQAIKSPTTARPLYSSKLGDQKTRPSAPASDNSGSSPGPANRQPAAPQKAWTGAKNPITGRSQAPTIGPNPFDKHFLTTSLREGQKVHFTLITGAEFEGVYYNNLGDSSSCSLRMVQPKKGSGSTDIPNGAARREGNNMSFQRKDIVGARVISDNSSKGDGKTPNGNSKSEFRTDTAISKSRAGVERELQRWVPDGGNNVDGSLEKPNKHEAWDQFAENERRFGLTTDYDENMYTTTIDKSHPNYQQRMAVAEKAAREIERSVPTTAHVAEERVMDFAGGDDQRDEEEKYSGVRRQDFPPLQNRGNKYTPPARRAPTGHMTVKGAPVDPAIISSQLKAPAPKQTTAKSEENKAPTAKAKVSTAPTADTKLPEVTIAEPQPIKPDAKTSDTTPLAPKPLSEAKGTAATPLRPSAATSRTISPQTGQANTSAILSATATVERDVLHSFKTFASLQRQVAEKARTNKAKADKEVKLTELKKFATEFKLSTPVPSDLISIIAKDPVKQKQIQEKAQQNAEDIARTRAAETAAAALKDKAPSVAKDSQPKAPAEPAPVTAAATTTVAAPLDPRNTSRPAAPQHSSSPSAVPGRHPGARQPYGQQPHYNNNGNNTNNNQSTYRGNRQPSHLGGQQAPQTGGLAQRIRENKMHQPQHQHMNQHIPVDNMRLPPTGPASTVDQPYGRRLSGLAPPHMQQPKLNPNSHEFRPNAFAAPFNPTGPSQGSSPRSTVNNVVETPPAIAPAAGQLIRRKTRAIDVKKCFILGYLKTVQPPQGQNWDENLGLRSSFATPPTWRQLQEETEKPDSTMNLTYKEFFEKLPLAAAATPNPPPMVPMAHHHQLPFHLQHSNHNLAQRQSPHMAPMQMHTGQHIPVQHMTYSSGDDHRMMHSNSAQSFASPRMAPQVPMAYAPNMNTPAQMAYAQPVMQPFINPGAQQMNSQFRSYSNNPQFLPHQPPHMGGPMMMQPQFMAPTGMVAGAPQMPMYGAGGQHFMAPGAVPPQSVAGSNGFPSPGRPAATMMVHQGSHQGQTMYGVSPGMQYQQVFVPQQAQNKYPGQRP